MLLLVVGASQAQQVSSGEWFWDTDPGTGNATPISATDGNFDEAIEELMESSSNIPANGTHTFNLRVQGSNGNWSPLFTTVVETWESLSALQNAEVVMAEFFWDTDPGEGSGTPMLAMDGNFDEAVEAITASSANIPASIGPHVLYVRAQEDEANWGPTFATVVDVWANLNTARTSFVKSAEYYFDTDPGAGNGTSILAQDGNFNQTLEAIIGGDIPAPVSIGYHTLYIRPMDEEDEWGPSFGIVVNMDTALGAPPFNTVMAGDVDICQPNLGGSYVYTATEHTGTSFEWEVTGGTIVDGFGTHEVEITWDGTAPYSVEVVECDVTQVCDSVELVLNVLQPVTHTESLEICDGDSAFLAGAWQHSAGPFDDIYTAANTCDSTVTTTLVVNPVYDLNESTTVCDGESFTFPDGSMQTINSQVIHTSNLTTVASNCDSTITTTVNVNPTYEENITVELCDGDSIYLEGDWQFGAGPYSDDLQSVITSCDSTVNTTVVLNDTYLVQENLTLMPGDSAYLENEWQHVAGTYFDTLQTTITNCDSVIETNFQYSPVGIDEHGLNVRVYPNPSVSGQTITAEFAEVLGTIDLEILDMAGRIVYSKSNRNQQIIRLNLNLATGIYRLRLIADEKEFGEKLIVR